MSWGRIDDNFWCHEKTEALREANEYAALALWGLVISFTGQKRRSRITVGEAAMLLCCASDCAEAACEALAKQNLFERDSASSLLRKQYVVHDWKEYRSKSEAKANAGRQGGVKSGESRRSNVEANPKQTDTVALKQTRSPEPEPEPVLDRYIGPTQNEPTGPPNSTTPRPDEMLIVARLEQLGYSRYGPLGGLSLRTVRELCPVTGQEFLDAQATPGTSWNYFAKVVRSIRERPPPQPGGSKKREPPKPDPNRFADIL